MHRHFTTLRFTVAAIAVCFATVGLQASVSAKTGPKPAVPGQPQFYSGDNGGASGTAFAIDHGQTAQLTSVGTGYGLVNVGFKGSATFSELSHLSTNYDVTQGICSGGSPRFQIDVQPAGDKNPSDGVSLYVYFGTQPYGGCTEGANTQPDAITTSGTTFWAFGGGADSNVPLTYGEVLATYGGYRLLDAQIAADGGWAQAGGTQQVLVNNWTVNDKTFFVLGG